MPPDFEPNQPGGGAPIPEPQIQPENVAAFMKERMNRIKAKDKELGGHLITIVGSGENEAILFKSSLIHDITTGESSVPVSEYLVATLGGYKSIQFDNGDPRVDNYKQKVG